MPISRRGFLEFAALAGAQTPSSDVIRDGPAAQGFRPIPIQGDGELAIHWGIPFTVAKQPIILDKEAVTRKLEPTKAGWLVFLHTTDLPPRDLEPMRGEGRLNELAAEYIVEYTDGTEQRLQIRRRHHIGAHRTIYGETCFQAVPHIKPFPVRPLHEQNPNFYGWGGGEMRGRILDRGPWVNWLWAWQNPHPDKPIAAIRFEPKSSVRTYIAGLSAGEASTQPLQWRGRRRAVLQLPEGFTFDYTVDRFGRRKHIQADMGQIISVEPRGTSTREVLIEYTAHPDARIHLWDGRIVPIANLEAGPFVSIPAASQKVRIRVLDKTTRQPVPVRLHIHGEHDEYYAPVDRHRWINPQWFEDYGPEYLGPGRHRSTYINGETTVLLPQTMVHIEVTKGFEIKPVRLSVKATDEIEIELQKVLPWRDKGWVTADTHVHFLSPQTANLEGAAEGVNVVNLLAAQWGELLTNVGDFDGKTTYGSGEHLVRIGSENRQRVLGHISLLGYRGDIIAPMGYGGPDEAALGDPVGILLMEWAEQCRRQGGLVVLPHFPNPRGENAASIVEGLVDGIEMSAAPTRGIDPYCLADYYRYLNCGYFVPAVGGTDKMSTERAVGDVRTYSRIAPGQPLNYDAWMQSIRTGHTFVTCGPLLEFSVEGKPAGARIDMTATGGTVNITWEAASLALPMAKADLIINGEVRESRTLKPDEDNGQWSVKVDRSSWIALLIRALTPAKREIIAAHTSPVMVHVEGKPFFSAVDAATMLDQIEGALAYIDTVGTRAEDEVYKRMRLRLTSAYRKLHDELHRRGHSHDHTSVTHHD